MNADLATVRFFRYESMQWAPPVDERGNPDGAGSIEVIEHVFRVTRKTPKGVWIENLESDFFHFRRFVRNEGKKRFAYPTREEAREGFRRRKARQISILKKQLQAAEVARELIDQPEGDQKRILF